MYTIDPAIEQFGALGYVSSAAPAPASTTSAANNTTATADGTTYPTTDPHSEDNALQQYLYEHTPVGTTIDALNNPASLLTGTNAGAATDTVRNVLYAIAGLVLLGVGAKELLEA